MSECGKLDFSEILESSVSFYAGLLLDALISEHKLH